MNILPRKEWGFPGWTSQPYSVALSERQHFVVHYHGGAPIHDRGAANAREIDGIHRGNGWSGIGYNFIVGQDGVVREGRGWNLVGAHCPSRNRDGIGVYVAIGGSISPTAEAKAAVAALYEEACARTGRRLKISRHGDWLSTSCCGAPLSNFVWSGLAVPNKPAPPTVTPPTSTPTSGGFLMALTDKQQDEIYSRVMYGIPAGDARGPDGAGRFEPNGAHARVFDSADGDYLRQTFEAQGLALRAAVDALAAAQGLDPAQISEVIDKAVRESLSNLRITSAG